MGSELLNYFNGDDLAANVWQSKYAQEGEKTPDDMHRRLAKEFARIEEKYKLEEPLKDRLQNLSSYGQKRDSLSEESIYNLFKDFKYIVPQGSIMSQLGSKSIGSLSNCFVIGQPEDSYGGIFQKDEEMAQLMKRRGGVGLDISTLRPKDTRVSNAAKSTTGAISFMHRFSNTTNEVAQNGRRGALMLSIDINHPDVMDFIKIKRDKTSVTGANISIKINDEFMKAVENDEDYILRFPCDLKTVKTRVDNINNASVEGELDIKDLAKDYDYDELYKVTSVGYIKKIKAKEYWDEIIKSAHGYAEPGIIFVDNHHDYSPDGVYPQFKGVTTNPCGEIFMQPYDACRLIALNLYSFIENPFTKDAYFDKDKFYSIAYEAMRLSDNLIDLELEHINRILDKIISDPESHPAKVKELSLWVKIRDTALASRRTGLGFTALGDMLAALGYKYDSDNALLFIEQLSYLKMEAELDCTVDLAVLRGPFEGWDKELEFPSPIQTFGGREFGNTFYRYLWLNFPSQARRMMRFGRRNVSWNTVAPTGTVSLLTQTTSGLEPLFMPFYMRRKKVTNDSERVDFVDDLGIKWQEFPVLHPKFKDWLTFYFEDNSMDGDIDYSSKDELQSYFEISPWYGSTANDIDWIKRVEVQGIIQRFTTHSISSTINLPNSVSTEEVSKIYLESWKNGLKGITVYRDGSRDGVLVASTKRDSFEYIDATKRPRELKAEVHVTKVAGQSYNVFIGLLNNKPYEVFLETGSLPNSKGTVVKVKKGVYVYKPDNMDTEIAISSKMTDEQSAITRLVSTSLRHGADIKFVVEQINKCDGDLFSFTKGLARVLKKYIPDGVKSTVSCQDCSSSNVIFEEGCNKCKDCGSSKCG